MNLLKIYTISLIFLSPIINPIEAMSAQRDNDTYVDNDEDDLIEEDVWFGPGYYYGVWFDDEDDYWEWRRGHRHYPPNRNYYHKERPIHYQDEENHGGEGSKGGGGHHGGGGGHGGGHK